MHMATLKTFFAMAGFVAAMISGIPAHASVTIEGTRVVYPSDAKEVTIKLSNNEKRPSLVQTWLDNANQDAGPGKADVPFVLTPPVSRIDPGKSQTLRLSYTGEPLAKDKETLFWLNVLDIPPKTKSESDAGSGDQARLNFAFRTRIKVFFRPAGLPFPVTDAPSKLQWKLVPADKGKGYAFEVTNPTPYHISFSSISLKVGDRTFTSLENKGMVAPNGTQRFAAMPDVTAMPGSGAKVAFEIINDYGGKQALEAPLAP
jgi:chaperone protein EcpD